MIETRELRFRYPSTAAGLSDVSITVPAGKLVTILGPNGSGKSTLLRILARVLRAESGGLRLDGKDISEWRPGEWARTVGYLPQDIEPAFPTRAIDAVRSGLSAWLPRFGIEGEPETRRAREALERLDAAALADRYLGEMSGGERKRVLLARVLVGEPRVLLLDEPLSSLDVAHVAQLGRELARLTAQGVTAVVVAHDFLWASAFSDIVIVMDDGRVAGFGPPAEALTGELIESVFGVRALSSTDSSGRSWIMPGLHANKVRP